MILRSALTMLALSLTTASQVPGSTAPQRVVTSRSASAAPVTINGAAPDEVSGWDGTRPQFSPPVDAPVADPFRPPAGPFGPGNRGIEYATTPGTPVGAIGSGIVAFAGPVAGRGVVSVDHPSGLRSTYTGLAALSVAVGDRVAEGQLLGYTRAHLHLGLRDGRRYLDPALFFGGARAVLVE